MARFVVVLVLLCIAVSDYAQSAEVESHPYDQLRAAEVGLAIQRRFQKIRRNVASRNNKYHEAFHYNRIVNLQEAIEGGFLVYHDTLDGYLEDVLDELLPFYGFDDEDILLLVSESPNPNAIAYGNGIIIVNIGLFRRIDHRSQLAMILAHELAHEYLAHMKIKLDNRIEIFTTGRTDKELRKLRSMDSERREVARELLKELEYAASARSREHETEADSMAFIYLGKSAYDPSIALTALKNLERPEKDSTFHRTLRKAFSFEQQPFDESWFEWKKKIRQPDLVFDPERIKSHPDYTFRADLALRILGEHIDTSGGTPYPIDTLLSEFRKMGEIAMSDYYLKTNAQLLGFYHVLRAWEKRPDQVHLVECVADMLHKLVVYKNTAVVMPRPYGGYPADINDLFKFLRNIRTLELARAARYFILQNHPDALDSEKLQEYLKYYRRVINRWE